MAAMIKTGHPYIKVFSAVLLGFIVFGSLLFVPVESLQWIQLRVVVPVLALGVAWLAYLLWGLLRKDVSSRSVVITVIFIIGLASSYLLVHSSYGYRYDQGEYEMVSTSLGMHMDRENLSVGRLLVEEGIYKYVDGHLNRGPFLFPFLLSLVHGLLGYHSWNVFVLNTGLAVGSVFLMYRVGRYVAAGWAGVLSVLLFVGLPMMSVFASSAGPGVSYVCLFLWIIYLALRFDKAPGGNCFLALCIFSVMAVYIDYSAVLMLLIPLYLGVKKSKEGREQFLDWRLSIVPLLLFPLFVQFGVFIKDSWDTYSLPNSLELLGNLAVFLFDFGGNYPGSLLLSVVGGLSFCFVVASQVKARRISVLGNDSVLSVLSLVILVSGLQLMFRFVVLRAGDIDASDIYLVPLHICFILSILWVLRRARACRLIWQVACGVAFVYLICVSSPFLSQGKYLESDSDGRAVKWELAQFEGHGKPELLIVTDDLYPWTVYGYQSIRYERAIERKEVLRKWLKNIPGAELYIVVKVVVDPGSGELLSKEIDRMGKAYEFDIEKKYIKSDFSGVALCRVSSVR